MGKLRVSLFLMRVSVFVFMLVYALDKFVHPWHARAAWARAYSVGNVPDPLVYAVGVLQLLLCLGFLFGIRKTFCTGMVLVIQGVVTALAWQAYLQPWSHLSAFAAFPLLAVCYALFVLRDADTLLSANVR